MSIKINCKNPLINTRRHYLISLVLVLIIFAVYFQVGQFEFIDYDDNLYVVDNHVVKAGLSQKGLRWAFKATYAANWHPLTWLSHMLDVQLYGLNSGAHHLTNLLIHILNSVLLFHVFRNITGTLWRSAFVAALFAFHPLHVESVAWVADRKGLLSTFFCLVTMLSYTKYVRQPAIWRYLLVMMFYALGLMAKPMVVTLPFVLMLLDYWPFKRIAFAQPDVNWGDGFPNKIFFRLLLEKIPLFMLMTASCVVTFIVQNKGGAVESLVRYPFADRMANALISYARYVLKMIWPSNLAVFYPHPGSWPFGQVAGAFAFLLLISLFAVKTYGKKPYLLVGWLWYIGTLVPVIGLVQVGTQAMADRYTYIPLIGLFIMVAWGADELLNRWPYRGFSHAAAGVAILLVLTATSWRQIGFWQNSITLFQHAIEVTGNNLTAHNNLGIALARKGDPQAAIHHYSIVLEKEPNQAKTHNNLGNALSQTGKISEAEVHYSNALRINPRHSGAHNNLANVLARRGKPAEAIQHYLQALNIDPEYTDAHYNLGNVFMGQERFDEAIAQYLTVLRIDPFYAAAQKNLAVSLTRQSSSGGAVKVFSGATSSDSEDMPLKDNRKKIKENQNKNETVIAEMQVLLAKKSYDPEVHMIIGKLYQNRGDLNSAETYYGKAILIEPDYYEAIKSMGMTKALQGKYDQAINFFKKLIILHPDAPEGFYLVAKTYARQNRVESATDWLLMAVEKGFNNWDLLKADENFNNIKHTEVFQRIIKVR